jgi:hypothetical protein
LKWTQRSTIYEKLRSKTTANNLQPKGYQHRCNNSQKLRPIILYVLHLHTASLELNKDLQRKLYNNTIVENWLDIEHRKKYESVPNMLQTIVQIGLSSPKPWSEPLIHSLEHDNRQQ